MDGILYHYYKLLTNDGLSREATYSYRSGKTAPEDRAYGLFCFCFFCWLVLLSLLINLVLYHKLRATAGFAALLLFIPCYILINKKYGGDFEIVAVYEQVKKNGETLSPLPTFIYSSAPVLVLAAVVMMAFFKIP